MDLVTALVIAILLLWLLLVLRRVKRKKAAAFGCGGDCSKCLAGCAYRRQGAGEDAVAGNSGDGRPSP